MTDQAPSTAAPAPATPVAPPAPGKTYFWGTGRRKTAIARVRVRPGSGKIAINKREFNNYFPIEALRNLCVAPMRATETLSKVDVFVNVHGGGPTGQAGAMSLGLARALVAMDTAHEPSLRAGQYLTRDSRKVERKKYGRAGARRRFQFSKR